MNGIHDMGGRHGFGGSLRERDEQSFHHPWERRVMGMLSALAAQGCFNADRFRHAIERIDPTSYFAVGYWGRWLQALETLVAEDDGRPRPGAIADRSARREEGSAPRFAEGDAVRVRNLHPAGHTRLPGYVRGRRGSVVKLQGTWVFPDTNAHGRGENPQPVYAIAFEGEELWGAQAEVGTRIVVDLFESYLEPIGGSSILPRLAIP